MLISRVLVAAGLTAAMCTVPTTAANAESDSPSASFYTGCGSLNESGKQGYVYGKTKVDWESGRVVVAPSDGPAYGITQAITCTGGISQTTKIDKIGHTTILQVQGSGITSCSGGGGISTTGGEITGECTYSSTTSKVTFGYMRNDAAQAEIDFSSYKVYGSGTSKMYGTARGIWVNNGQKLIRDADYSCIRGGA